VEPTTSHRPPNDGVYPAATSPAGVPWLAARLGVVALIPWTVIGVFRATFAVGGRWAVDSGSEPGDPVPVTQDVRRANGPTGHPATVGWWSSVLVAVLLNRLVWLYQVVTSDGGKFEGSALDRRAVAYPLWTAATVMIVVTAFLTARVVWPIPRRSNGPPWPSPPAKRKPHPRAARAPVAPPQGAAGSALGAAIDGRHIYAHA
jgi:hypothetical protein